MTKLNIKDYIRRELSFEEQEIALDFVAYLESNGLTFYKDDDDCWKNKIYYWCKCNDDCVCFISIKDLDEPQNLWTVWSADLKSEWFENYDVNDIIKELAWKHIDHCGHCSSCGGGRRKVVFGREFKAICGCTFRFDHPSVEDLSFLKEMIKLCIMNYQKEVKS